MMLLTHLTLFALMVNFEVVVARPETEVVINDSGGGGNRTLMVVVFTEETSSSSNSVNNSNNINNISSSNSEDMSSVAPPPPPFCRNLSHPHPDKEYLQFVVFWVEGVALSLCGITGIVGNILTCVVLAKISLNNVFNQLIVMLCTFDTLFNAIAILEYSLKKAFGLLSYSTPIYVNLWPKCIYPFQNITYSASLCITMAIAVERYVTPTFTWYHFQFVAAASMFSTKREDIEAVIELVEATMATFRYLAVCHPFFVHQDSTLVSGGSSASFFKKRTLRYLLPALTFAFLINIPKFFEFRNFVTEENTTYIQPTEIRLNNDYQVYYISWTRTILHAFLPFILLAVLNGRIIHQIWKAEKIAARAMNRSVDRRDHVQNGGTSALVAVHSTSSSSSSKREAKLARILVLLVFSFLVCNLGKLVINIFDLDQLANIATCEELNMEFLPPRWVPTLLSFNHLLIVTNASTNLVLFSLIGTQFRATLLAILRLRKSHGRMSHLQNGSPTLDPSCATTTNHHRLNHTTHTSYRVTVVASIGCQGPNGDHHNHHHHHRHASNASLAKGRIAGVEEHEMTAMLNA